MSDAAPAAAAPPAPKKKKKVFAIICLMCIVAGAAAPMFVNVPGLFGKSNHPPEPKPKAHGSEKLATIPFGEVIVNLAEDRMTRYLRVKIVLSVEAEHEKPAGENVAKHKAALRNWLISHLAGKSLKDVGGTVGVKRLQREILERFEDVLYPAGDGHLRDVLFEEYVVQ